MINELFVSLHRNFKFRGYISNVNHFSALLSPPSSSPLTPYLSAPSVPKKSHSYNMPLPHNPPPSTVTHAPLMWLAARLAKNTTVPAISSGRPKRPFGFSCATTSSPPCLAMRPEAILEGKKPGAMLLLRMWRGPRSTARLRVRWITAAGGGGIGKV